MNSFEAEKEKIAVWVMAPEPMPQSIVEPILWGLEEEGIPADLRPADSAPAPLLAKRAADGSPLNVGIGINAADRIVALHHRDLPAERPLFSLVAEELNPISLRRLGANAARLVTGDPFISQDESLIGQTAHSVDAVPTQGLDDIVTSVVQEILRKQGKR